MPAINATDAFESTKEVIRLKTIAVEQETEPVLEKIYDCILDSVNEGKFQCLIPYEETKNYTSKWLHKIPIYTTDIEGRSAETTPQGKFIEDELKDMGYRVSLYGSSLAIYWDLD